MSPEEANFLGVLVLATIGVVWIGCGVLANATIRQINPYGPHTIKDAMIIIGLGPISILALLWIGLK